MKLLGSAGWLLCSCYGVLSGLVCCCAVAKVFLVVAMQLLWCSEWFSLLL